MKNRIIFALPPIHCLQSGVIRSGKTSFDQVGILRGHPANGIRGTNPCNGAFIAITAEIMPYLQVERPVPKRGASLDAFGTSDAEFLIDLRHETGRGNHRYRVLIHCNNATTTTRAAVADCIKLVVTRVLEIRCVHVTAFVLRLQQLDIGLFDFEFDAGVQGSNDKFRDGHAWAVRTGDVAAQAVPIPGALWLFGAALGLLSWARRKT